MVNRKLGVIILFLLIATTFVIVLNSERVNADEACTSTSVGVVDWNSVTRCGYWENFADPDAGICSYSFYSETCSVNSDASGTLCGNNILNSICSDITSGEYLDIGCCFEPDSTETNHKLLACKTNENKICESQDGRNDIWCCAGGDSCGVMFGQCSGGSVTSTCGNHVVEYGEVCDGGGLPCTTSQGTGTRACLSDCSGYSSTCTVFLDVPFEDEAVCGNNKIEPGETCEGTVMTNSCTTSEGYSGRQTCQSTTTCTWDSCEPVMCPDSDGDGYEGRLPYLTCKPSNTNGYDCDDSNANVNPGKTEIAGSGIDENCDGFSAPVFTGDGQCIVTTNSYCASDGGYHPIIGLSNYYNAFATKTDSITTSNSPFVLCCNFGNGSTTQCGAANSEKILGISGNTNAKIEIPENNNYEPVCYVEAGLVCTGSDSTITTDVQDIINTTFTAMAISDVSDAPPILGLSDDTNAFAGTPSGYEWKIWCGVGPYCGDTQTLGNEECDLSDPATATQTCTTTDGYTGSQSCLSDCSDYETCLSTDWCGDTFVNGEEECDSGSNCIMNIGSGLGCTCEEGYDSFYDYNGYGNWCEYNGAAIDTNYWSSTYIGATSQPADDIIIQNVPISSGETTIYMGLAAYSGLTGSVINDIVYFEVYKYNGWLGAFDNEIRGPDNRIEGEVIALTPDIVAVGNWTVTHSDLEAMTGGDYDNIYFKAYYNGDYIETESEYVSFGQIDSLQCDSVVTCLDYSTQETCEIDDCDGGAYGVELNNPNINCDDPNIDCSCWWDTTTSSCNSIWTDSVSGGTCEYSESSDDDCTDGFLSYVYNAIWSLTGGESQEYGCVSGENVMPCPARVQLPLRDVFSWSNIMALIIILVIVYFVLNSKKSGKKVSKKSSRKKR